MIRDSPGSRSPIGIRTPHSVKLYEIGIPSTLGVTPDGPPGLLPGTATLNVAAVSIVLTPTVDTLDAFDHEVYYTAEARDAGGPLIRRSYAR